MNNDAVLSQAVPSGPWVGNLGMKTQFAAPTLNLCSEELDGQTELW